MYSIRFFEALKQGKEVQLVGFGKFDVRSREARMEETAKPVKRWNFRR
ncbi:HU family DNA-binding protein [Paenibacillus larvae]|nr:HU family DNA-binding protein [Paenibacillus larvae]MDT2237644.1 HU family DNA-binding protein [Paenibacillus larvae]